jgi:hypothetical protein
MRGQDLGRVEGFSDCVFAFALTLLVVSLEVPRSLPELFAAVRGFLAFGICFAFLMLVWFDHHRFFRSYGLEDTTTLVLNALLLFVVLIYVYPMKFLFGFLVDSMVWRIPPPATQPGDMGRLMVVYGSGFLAVSVVLGLMYRHALRQGDQLELDPLERLDAKARIWGHGINAGVALASLLIAGAWPRQAGWAGMLYWAIAPLRTWHGSHFGGQRRRLAQALSVAQNDAT